MNDTDRRNLRRLSWDIIAIPTYAQETVTIDDLVVWQGHVKKIKSALHDVVMELDVPGRELRERFELLEECIHDARFATGAPPIKLGIVDYN